MRLKNEKFSPATTTCPANMVTLASWRVRIHSDRDLEGHQWKYPVLSYFIWKQRCLDVTISFVGSVGEL